MGKAGVSKVLEIIRKELDITMALWGERDVTQLGRHNIDPLSPLLKALND